MTQNTLFDVSAHPGNPGNLAPGSSGTRTLGSSAAACDVKIYRLAPINPEIDVRNRVLEAMEANYKPLLDWLRDRMQRLYLDRLCHQGRELAFVTADDARLILDTDPQIPGPDRLCRNFLGQLFRAPGWSTTGQIRRSSTPGSHGNLLMCWRYEPKTQKARP